MKQWKFNWETVRNSCRLRGKYFLVNSNEIHAFEVAKIELENSERFHVKEIENWQLLRKNTFHVHKVENQQFLNKDLFQIHRCVIIFLRMSTIAFKLFTPLSWNLKNQFGVGYPERSYYKYYKLIESCFLREIS